MKKIITTIHNNEPIPLNKIPVLNPGEFTEELGALLSSKYHLSAYFADLQNELLYAVCSDAEKGLLYVLAGKVDSGQFISLTPRFPQTQLFEREIFEETGFTPVGHPWLKPVRFPPNSKYKIGEPPFFKMEGDEIHEVAVGPVHAGVIEPGHFRFQCHGEKVYHLEISLGYQHRGIEKKIVSGSNKKNLYLIETAAGDTTIGHTTAYTQILEYLTNNKVSISDNIVRSVALELERCANHVGDIGALAGDAGFLPTHAFCGRIRGDFLNMTALLCGNRFGRGLIVPGGIGYQISDSIIEELSAKIKKGLKEFLDASKLMFDNPSIVARFQSIGELNLENSIDLGIVGPAARAAGITRDIRQDFAYGNYRFSSIPVSGHIRGNVYERAYVRWLEVQVSVKYILDQLNKLNNSDKTSEKSDNKESRPKKNSLIVSLVEGWRGQICHTAITDNEGNFRKYKIYDPSFYNWFGLAQALRNQQISDFPLCNKSFNLSYCGHDL